MMKHEISYRAGSMVEAGGRKIVLLEELRVLRAAGFLSVQRIPLGLLIAEGETQYLFPLADWITLAWVEAHHPELFRARSP